MHAAGIEDAGLGSTTLLVEPQWAGAKVLRNSNGVSQYDNKRRPAQAMNDTPCCLRDQDTCSPSRRRFLSQRSFPGALRCRSVEDERRNDAH